MKNFLIWKEQYMELMNRSLIEFFNNERVNFEKDFKNSIDFSNLDYNFREIRFKY